MELVVFRAIKHKVELILNTGVAVVTVSFLPHASQAPGCIITATANDKLSL